MKKRSISIACMLAAGLVAGAVGSAQAESGRIYLGGAAGVAIPKDSTFTTGGTDTNVDLDQTPALSAFIGRTFSDNWRGEIELGWRAPDVGSVGGVHGSGDISATHLMLNGIYDFGVDLNPTDGIKITPYLGGGIGPTMIHVDGLSPIGGSSIDKRKLVLGFQGIAGLDFHVSDQASAFVDYRYFQTTDFSVDDVAGTTSYSSSYADHRIMVGFRWTFGGPEKPKPMPVQATPAPAPAPAPAPKPVVQPKPKPKPAIARNYLVFFDWDKAAVRPDAQQILKTAAENAKKGGVSHIVLTGHADRSGPAAYNEKLSKRRAENVAKYMESLGIPKGEMTVTWKGERDPLVPTPDGVREPQNRRVQIVFP